MLTSPGWRGPISQLKGLTVFSIGLVLGAALTVSVLWLVTTPARDLDLGLRVGIVIAAGVVIAAREWGIVSFWLPANRRQVPATLMGRDSQRAAFQFGVEMGTAARTHMTASTPYLAAVAVCLLAGMFWQAALAALGFGIGRAIMTWTGVPFRADRDTWTRLLERRSEFVRRSAVLVCVGALSLYGFLVAVGGVR